MRTHFRLPALASICLLFITKLSAQVSITSTAVPYTQNFNTLITSGTSSVLPAGWKLLETGTNANTTLAADAGATATGNTYSYGTGTATDRAFGGLLSGSLTPVMGVQITNNTGSTITSLTISYTGEEWRLGTAARADQLDFQYSLSATSLSTGTWTDFNALEKMEMPQQTEQQNLLSLQVSAFPTAVPSGYDGMTLMQAAQMTGLLLMISLSS
jgi:hypothetical protein